MLHPINAFQMLDELREKVEGVSREFEEVREEGGRVRLELRGREERVREMETEVRALREEGEEKERLLKKKDEVC